ncbi:MAG: hypothetical protein GY893_04950, partial [bacterium]|nr:hypothetical protein [bacterium]
YQLCTVDETAVSVFDLAEGSFLLGDGDLSGVLQLSHMPSSYNKRFQLGDGVNNHNCNYGLGGWFSWDGIINGEEVDGLSGDIVIDLENCVEEQLECEEYSELVFTAIDLDCGRVLSTTVRVDRNDTTAPVISAGPLDATAECDDVPAVADNSEVIATDNCAGDVTIAYEGEVRVDGDCPDSYTLIRRWSATDVCGNESIHTQTLTIEDTTAPDIDPAASDATVECDGAGNGAELTAWLDSNGGASATDNCGDVTWSNDFIECEIELGDFLTYKQDTWGSSNSNSASDALDASFDDVFPIGLTAGCSDGYELLFTNSDAIDTYLPCTGGAQDLVLTHGGSDPTEAATDPTCWDNSLVSHLITAKLNVGFDAYFSDFSPSEEWTGNLIATDGLFKGMSVIEIIELGDQVLGDCNNDYTPGELRESLRLFNKNFKNGNTDLGHFFVAGCITDDCGETGSVIVTFTATDDCDNSSSTTATFTIEDTTDPVLTNDPSITILCDEYPDEIVYASASDDCGDVTITFVDIPVSGGCLVPVGAYLRTYTATDDCGNISTSEQVVTLVDETAPVITAPADYSTNADADDCSADISPAAAGEASATDNCDSDVAITSSDSEWTYTCDGDDDNTEGTRTLTRTWTATDDCGNASSATQSITVVDITAPVGSAEDADVACAEYDASTEYGSHSESDNCDSDVATSWVNVETFDVEGAGCYKVRREYTFVDDCGNSSTAEQIITVFDDV